MNPFVQRGGLWVVAQTLLMLAVGVGGVAFRPGGGIPATFWTGGALIFLGAVVGIAGAVTLGPNRTAFPRPLDKATLVQTGVYGWVRHPLYASVLLLSFGWGMIWGSWPALLLAAVEIAFFDAKSRREECWLRERFPDYADYQKRVSRFIPWLY